MASENKSAPESKGDSLVKWFNQPENANKYGINSHILPVVPGYATFHRQVVQLLDETIPESSHVLVLGAGGGIELQAFHTAKPQWTFTGVDPAGAMLEKAKQVIGEEAASKVNWVVGYIPDAPEGPFDAATCLCTLHFVADDGQKLEALQAIHKRLKPGAPLVLLDLCLDKKGPQFDKLIHRYAQFAINSGFPAEAMNAMKSTVTAQLNCVSQSRLEELLTQAGFKDVELFFAGFSWRGLAAYA